MRYELLVNSDVRWLIGKWVICPNHTCVKQGWVNRVGYPVTCLPNGVYVMITSPNPDLDLIT